jgi:ABC-type multidrug transport system fused ATPase/permease subunit
LWVESENTRALNFYRNQQYVPIQAENGMYMYTCMSSYIYYLIVAYMSSIKKIRIIFRFITIIFITFAGVIIIIIIIIILIVIIITIITITMIFIFIIITITFTFIIIIIITRSYRWRLKDKSCRTWYYFRGYRTIKIWKDITKKKYIVLFQLYVLR